MPYSNRPHYGEPQPTGDYQQYGSIPRAPRAASFPEPSARGHQYGATGGYAAHNSARSVIPSAPNSLSPVAMASARNAIATGPQHTMDAGPSRPSAKAGMSILFAGAIIGGLIGAVMHAREKAEIAFAAHDTHEVVVVPNGADKPPVVVTPAGSNSAGGVIVAPEKIADKKDATDKKDADKDKKKGTKRVAWVGGGKKTTTATETETVASAEETPAPSKGKKAKSKDDDDGYTVASADGSGKSEPAPKKVEKVTEAKPEKAEPKKAAEKEAKAEKPEKAEPKKSGKNDDAVKLLKEAMGVTENSL